MDKKMKWSVKDGQTLRKTRKTYGMSQAQLGQKVGVTSSRICEIEKVNFPCGRKCTPAQKLADKIAAVFAARRKLADKHTAKA